MFYHQGLKSIKQVCDMPMLFEKLWTESKRTVAYPMHEPWLDVGRPDDLQKADGMLIGDIEDGVII